MSQDYYVYTLAYPDGTVFYVGKGKGERIDQHEAEARRGIQSYKCKVIRQIWQSGGQILKTKICEHMEEEAAYQLEIDLIRMYGREHLVNRTDGGGSAPSAAKHPRIAVSFSGPILDLIYDALALEGNADPTPQQIADAAYYAVRTVYGKRIEDQKAIIL